MKEMTDQELTDKIKQVFDDFQDPSAEHGWGELRKKYPEHNTKPVLLWWAAAAAVLVMACGLWLLMPEYSATQQQLAEEKPLPPINKNTNEPIAPEETNRVAQKPEPLAGHVNTENISSNPNPALPLAPAGSSLTNRATSAAPGKDFQDAGTKPLQATALSAMPDVLASQLSPDVNSLEHHALLALPKVPEKVVTAEYASQLSRDSVIEAKAKLLAQAQPDLLSDPHQHLVKEAPRSAQEKAKAGNSFSFYAGSFFNYSLGSETELNFGAGFTSDIKLGKNVRLTTGLALANNTLTYNNGVPSSNKQNLTFDMPSPSLGSATNNSLTTITKYDANLLVLDIPVNIKYLLIPDANKLYLSAGLSSGTYLSEKYSINHTNYSVAGNYINQTQGEDVKKELERFDFARTLNISFGYSANLGKTQNITIEPFLKYPLGGLGSENLKFGSTGLNLKLNFSHFKKR